MKVGFVGAGKMGEAIVASLIRARVVRPCDVYASDVSASRRKRMSQRYGVNVSARNHWVLRHAHTVFLAVKPHEMDKVLEGVKEAATGRHLLISIAAGKRLCAIERSVPKARIIRVMPNLPALVSEGMSVFCAGGRAGPVERKRAARLLACFGKVLELPEEEFDAVTALSGSGPAFFAYLLDCMIEAGAGQGLDRGKARVLAEQTMLGTARLMSEKGIDPKDLVRDVASPRGTTEAGLKVLQPSSVCRTLQRTIRAAAKRSRELSSA